MYAGNDLGLNEQDQMEFFIRMELTAYHVMLNQNHIQGQPVLDSITSQEIHDIVRETVNERVKQYTATYGTNPFAGLVLEGTNN